MSSSVTMADIARMSGVSLSTVSLVINQKPGIPHETRLKVLNAAHALGYPLKNQVAPEKVGRTLPVKTVGVFVKSQVDDPIPPTSNVFYSHVLAGIEENCRRRDLFLMLSVVQVDFNSFPLEIPRLISTRSVDAVLLVGICVNEMLLGVLKQAGLPVVLVDAYSYLHEYDSVVVENYEAGYQATVFLVEQGHRHIAFVGGFPDSHPSFLERRRGYLQALRDQDVAQEYIGNCSYNNPDEVRQVLSRLKHEHPEITALVACNDKVAIELMQVAGELGYNVPGELAVVGFDNITLADRVTPPLTTMDIDKVTMGRMAVEVALFRSNYPEAATIKTTVRPTLVKRQSVRPNP